MSTASAPRTFRFHPFHLRSDVDLLFRGEEIIPLEPQAVRVLRYLVEHHERVIPKRELHDAVWPGVFTTEDVLKKAISQARRALGDETRLYIKTFHTRGYRFVAPVVVGEEIAREQPHPDFDQLVGRDAELAALLHEYKAAEQGKGRPVVITGDPGIGKSQLAHYFAEEVRRDGALCLEARFSDYSASHFAPFETFLNLLRTALAQDSASLADTVRTRLGVTLPEELFSGARPSPSSIGDVFRAVVPICDCFVRLSRSAPLVIILDDLHWADPSSLEVVGYLMRTAERERLMLLGAMRSEESRREDSPIEEWLQRQAAYRAYTTLSLAPLSVESLRKTIDAVFGGANRSPEIPPAELSQLIAISGGNPYFFAEMLRLLLAQGALALTGERWSWKGTKELRLPENFVTAARVRLNGLAPEVRKLIDDAAVIGDEFRIATLASIGDGPSLLGKDNVIAFNGRSGVSIVGKSSERNGILSNNSIHSNTLLGIDLSGDGVTTNDGSDGDPGSNRLQNYPELNAAAADAMSTSVSGVLTSTPGSNFTLTFFSSPACDPSGFGEGQSFIGSSQVTTNATGKGAFSLTFPVPTPQGHHVTATATDSLRNTSEFSKCVVVGARRQ